jgi:cobalt/nickel transport system permease protein
MHIMEGFLDPLWCAVWFVIAIPFVVLGAKKIMDLVREHPEHKMTVALAGAFIFLLSSLKLPSVTGSSSHPTGTGFSGALYGVAVTSFLATIVLIFQAILLAHGGLTTLGANISSMGIIGPAFGILIWMLLVKGGVSLPISLGISAAFADLFTYVVTSFQLTLNYGQNIDAFVTFLSNFAVTQIPLSIVEGILFFMFGVYLMRNKPEVFEISAQVAAAKKEA